MPPIASGPPAVPMPPTISSPSRMIEGSRCISSWSERLIASRMLITAISVTHIDVGKNVLGLGWRSGAGFLDCPIDQRSNLLVDRVEVGRVEQVAFGSSLAKGLQAVAVFANAVEFAWAPIALRIAFEMAVE